MSGLFEIKTFNSFVPYEILLKDNDHFQLHQHSYVEIFFVKKGHIRITTKNINFFLDEGHICFIDSNTIHSIDQTFSFNEILIIQISTEPDSIFHSLQKYKIDFQAYLSDLFNSTLPLCEFQNTLNNICKEFTQKSAGYENMILSYIHKFIALHFRYNYLIPKTQEDFLSSTNLQRFSQIISYIENNYTKQLTLKSLSQDLNMNYYYVSHLFKNTAGISFQNYLNNLRLDKALTFFPNSALNLTCISYNVGFPNIKAFTLAFKKKYGFLPSEYRKKFF